MHSIFVEATPTRLKGSSREIHIFSHALVLSRVPTSLGQGSDRDPMPVILIGRVLLYTSFSVLDSRCGAFGVVLAVGGMPTP